MEVTFSSVLCFLIANKLPHLRVTVVSFSTIVLLT